MDTGSLLHSHLILPGIQGAHLHLVVSAKSPGVLIRTGVSVAALSHTSWVAAGESLSLSESLSSHVNRKNNACPVSIYTYKITFEVDL